MSEAKAPALVVSLMSAKAMDNAQSLSELLSLNCEYFRSSFHAGALSLFVLAATKVIFDVPLTDEGRNDALVLINAIKKDDDADYDAQLTAFKGALVADAVVDNADASKSKPAGPFKDQQELANRFIAQVDDKVRAFKLEFLACFDHGTRRLIGQLEEHKSVLSMLNKLRSRIFRDQEECLDTVKEHLLASAKAEAQSSVSRVAKLNKVELLILEADAVIRAWGPTAPPLTEKTKIQAVCLAFGEVYGYSATNFVSNSFLLSRDGLSFEDKVRNLRACLAMADKDQPAAAGGPSAHVADAPPHGTHPHGQRSGRRANRRHSKCHVCGVRGHSPGIDYIARLYVCSNGSRPFASPPSSNSASHTPQHRFYPSVTLLVDSGATHT